MVKKLCRLLLAVALGVGSVMGKAEEKKGQPVYTDPAKTDEDFPFQGEYTGTVDGGRFGIQVVALGKGKFDAVLCPGGLPGEGWDKKKNPRDKVPGTREGRTGTFAGQALGGNLADGTFTVMGDGKVRGTLAKVVRQSPTMGAVAPDGAVVLFDVARAEETVKNFKGGQLNEQRHLKAGVLSNQTFGSGHLHVEFLLPYMPEARGQGRGNSGCYLQGRYEVQMLDSFGLTGENNECGGIYTIAKPLENLCYPPLSWQTYDIDFTAATYVDGKMTVRPKVTVRHNGVVVQDQVELTHSTTASPLKEGPEPGPLHLQNHGNPVCYRNIWFVEKKD
ncbi:MAG: DUF1080 domain-containing protein [Verrucomicrobiales bacterium]